jgi:hypothetical protein
MLSISSPELTSVWLNLERVVGLGGFASGRNGRTESKTGRRIGWSATTTAVKTPVWSSLCRVVLGKFAIAWRRRYTYTLGSLFWGLFPARAGAAPYHHQPAHDGHLPPAQFDKEPPPLLLSLLKTVSTVFFLLRSGDRNSFIIKRRPFDSCPRRRLHVHCVMQRDSLTI